MAKRKTIGTITGTKDDGSSLTIYVDKQGGSIYLHTTNYQHLVHPSNERGGSEGWVREAALVFHIFDGIYTPL